MGVAHAARPREWERWPSARPRVGQRRAAAEGLLQAVISQAACVCAAPSRGAVFALGIELGALQPRLPTAATRSSALLKLCAATALELCAPATHAHTRASCAHARPFGLRTAAAAVAHLNGAALRSAQSRLTWPCSAPCTGLLCPRAADSALHGRPGVMDRGERELRAPRAAPRRLQAGWGWPGGGPRPRCGRLWWRRRFCGATVCGRYRALSLLSWLVLSYFKRNRLTICGSTYV